MELEDALRRLGATRRPVWQARTYAVYLLTQLVTAWSIYSRVFVFDTPSFHCKIPANSSINNTIPREFVNGQWKWSECRVFTNQNSSSVLANQNATTSCTRGYEFDDSYDSTIVTEWNLVCGRDALTELPMTIETVGHLLGSLVMGQLADVIGRKPIFLFSMYAGIVLFALPALSVNLTAFIVFMFLRGLLSPSVGGLCMIMSIELFPPEQRTLAGLGIHFSWLLGSVLYAPLAYLVRNWRYLILASEVPKLFILFFIWTVIESPTWLLSQNRHSDVESILRRAATLNKIVLPDHIFEKANNNIREENQQENRSQTWRVNIKRMAMDLYEKIDCRTQRNESHYGFLDLFRTPRMRLSTIVFCCLWFSHTIIYRSLALTVTYLHGNRYINYFLYELIELPAYIIAFVAMNRIGRRFALCSLQIASGVTLMATIIQKYHIGARLEWLTITLYLIGKASAAGSTSVLWLLTPESFPTTLRTRGLAVSGIFATVAGFIAPYSRTFTREVAAWIPPLMFGILSILCGMLSLLLPETLNRKLPETVEEVERWTPGGAERASDKQTLVEMDFADVESDAATDGVGTDQDLQPDDGGTQRDLQPVHLY